MTAKRKMKIILVLLSASATVVNSQIECRDTEWRCDRSRCIPKKWMCDGDPDCSDGTDEVIANCPTSPDKASTRVCRSTEFKCGNGNCIPKPWKCDGSDDCQDNSDEVDCSTGCSAKEFQCQSNQQCIAGRWRCDSFNDCEDGSDEVNCTVTTTPVPPHKFKCQSGISIPKKWVCDGESDCSDGSDEKDCDPESLRIRNVTASPRPSICRENEFQCGSYCVMKTWVCDGTNDCMNGEDEANCTECPSHQFQCADKKQCIPRHERCNLDNYCRDGSDEVDCPSVPQEVSSQCNLTTHFMCKRGSCIERRVLCDGRNNCGDWEDETEEVCGINECERNNGGCTQSCVDTREDHYCTCDSGYRLVGKYTCEDVDECVEVPGSCSQKCTNTIGGYHCSCQPGYERDPGNYTRCKAASGEPYLFFSHTYDIRSLRLKDRDMTSIVTDARGATALDYMYSSQEIVWSNNKENEIVRANLTTPDIREVLVTGERVSADGLAVDWIHNHIYYTDTGNFKIRMLSWDARWSKTIANEKLGQPRAIVVSPFDGYVFWTDWGSEPKIERVGLDGADRTAIIREPHVFWPNGITMDHSNDRIYWCDGKLNTISRANLDGSQIEVILFSRSFLRLPYSITVFEDTLYWTDWSQLALYSADKFTGEDIKNISAGHLLESPKVVHVFHEYRQPTGENVCESHLCSHFCVRTPAGVPLCACPDGLVLSSRDSLTCLDYDSQDNEFYDIIPTEIADNQPERLTNPQRDDNNKLIPTTLEHTGPLPGEPHIGMILGVFLGSTVVLTLGILVFVAWWKTSQGVVKRIRFNNLVYKKKTTDEEMDGGGYIIGQDDLLYNPTDFQNIEGPDVCMREDDNAPLTPKT
uniref:Lipoprotein receptor 2B n=1 Tax=Pandalus japonicus TaxID=666362 RepID=W8PRF1_PANJP|nr:lipoprotein receptor 2B [Pandalus japonicus]